MPTYGAPAQTYGAVGGTYADLTGIGLVPSVPGRSTLTITAGSSIDVRIRSTTALVTIGSGSSVATISDVEGV